MPSITPAPRKSSPLATALALLPCVLAVSFFTALQHLYHTRRRLTATPVHHPVLLFRDPRHCLSHPANRVFSVRPDRNILATSPLAHCFFEAQLVEKECRFVARVERSRMNLVLGWMMDVKKGCDRSAGLRSPLPWASEGVPAAEVEMKWVQLVATRIRRAGGRLWDGFGKEKKGGWYVEEVRRGRRTRREEEEEEEEMRRRRIWIQQQLLQQEDDEDRDLGYDSEEQEEEEEEEMAWFEIWEGVVRNRCEGWVVEPEHRGYASLEDDDEDPFTWVNSVRSNLKIFDGEWVHVPRRRASNVFRAL